MPDSNSIDFRVGIGFDAHPLAPERRLVIGGVEIPYHLGLAGHSDGDVLVHAIMDALLGAAALGDKGSHFPDTDPQYKGISSLLLLSQVGRLVDGAGWRISNVDATILAQKPRLSGFIETMRHHVFASCGGSPTPCPGSRRSLLFTGIADRCLRSRGSGIQVRLGSIWAVIPTSAWPTKS